MKPISAAFRRCAAVVALALCACGQAPVMRGQIEGLTKLASQAERNGAIRCAPRELALAKSHLRFAEVELDQGFVSRANAHLAIAEPNAHAAFDLSRPKRAPSDSWRFPRRRKIPTAMASSTRSTCACSRRKTRTATSTKTDVPSSTTIWTAWPTSLTNARSSRKIRTASTIKTAVPINDNDKDTLADVDDQCPNEAGPTGGDRPGCPRKSLVVVTDKEIKITQQIHFEFDKDVIRRESYPILDAVAEVLQKNPNMRIEVQGHTDNKGSAAYNLKLSDRRAASVRKYLVGKGISSDRLVSHGYGLTRPLVPNDSEQNRALNRRVQFMRTEGATP